MSIRPVCECGNVTAINYKKNGRTYYRKKCHKCITASKEPEKEEWQLAGYVKKIVCEKCGFRSKHADQISVIETNGYHNFKSVCLNCKVEIEKSGGWKSSGLTPDF